MDSGEKARRLRDYAGKLEEERRKIRVFHRELPLCLLLVSQVIESVREQMGCAELADEEPVMEEFIPLRPSLREEGDRVECEVGKKEKLDWLRSVQLWSQEDRNIEKKSEDGGEEKEKEKKERHSVAQKKARRSWSPELHRKFLHALQQIGGSRAATPKQIRERMKVDGLTNDEVKSHLQKYRLHISRPNSAVHCSGNSSPQTPQFFVVKGVRVDHAATAALPPAAMNRICSPVATLPSELRRKNNKRLQNPAASHLHSEDRSRHNNGMTDSVSLSTSSSSQTTIASLPP